MTIPAADDAAPLAGAHAGSLGSMAASGQAHDPGSPLYSVGWDQDAEAHSVETPQDSANATAERTRTATRKMLGRKS